MANKGKPKGLGRGLSALLADVDGSDQGAETAPEKRDATDISVPIGNIYPNPDQPRRDFAKEDMDDLIRSVKEKGIIQPLVVRPDPNNAGGYQIVAGERRWRAAQAAQIHELPVVVREFDDQEVLEIAIIENVQRADLNPIEEAMGYRQLMDSFGHTQEKMASALGKSRSHIANLLRLLNLPDDVLALTREGRLSAGHARSLVTAENPSDLAKKIIAQGLSVRQAEKLAKSGGSTVPNAPKGARPEKDADTKAIEGDLSAQLKMRVSIDANLGNTGGRLTIHYRDLDQLDHLLQVLSQ